MNNFVTHLKNNYNWPTTETLFPGGYQKKIPNRFYKDNSILDRKLIEDLKLVDLDVRRVDVLWKPAGHRIFGKYGVIHVDSQLFRSIPKILYVSGGVNSEMVWYDLNEHAVIDSHKWPVGGGDVLRVNSFDYVTEAHRESVRFSLVDVGTHMHGIDNPDEDRVAICCPIVDATTGDVIPYAETKQRLLHLKCNEC